MAFFMKYNSPIGPLLLISDGEALTGLYMNRELPAEMTQLPVFARAGNWLDDYFRGIDRQPDFPIHPTGTPFQQQVWNILQDIPWGTLRTYGDIARQMASVCGKPAMSAQAVGQAVGKNPISILIPCHRCVGAGGALTGYAAGLEKKKWLLRHEGFVIQENKII